MNIEDKKFVKNVVDFIVKNDIDVVHGDFISSYDFSSIKKKCPKKVRFYQHIHNSMYQQKNLYTFLKRIRNYLFLDKSILKICCSKSIVEPAVYMFPKSKVTSCANAIVFSRLTPANNNDAELNILMFGHNYYIKGVDLAIEAVIELNKKTPIHLDIVMAANIESNKKIIIDKYGKIPECISILPPVADVSSLYKSHKIFLNASIEEGMSYANIEAYYSGNLCLYSDIPQNKEPQLPGITYFKAGSLDSLLEAFEKVLLLKDNYSNDVDYVINEFSIEAWTTKMIKIMDL